LSKWFQTRRFLWEFPIGFHVKLSSAVAAILIGGHPRIISAKFGFIWFSGFRREDLNAIFYQNMHNLHNRYISAEKPGIYVKLLLAM
jgi:hypothetical protein